MVVGPPNAGARELAYKEFVTRYAHRKRVIYAGSNGGFVHGFNTGEWDTTLDPDNYNRGTGAEEFGFMAYPARKKIRALPTSTVDEADHDGRLAAGGGRLALPDGHERGGRCDDLERRGARC